MMRRNKNKSQQENVHVSTVQRAQQQQTQHRIQEFSFS